VSFDLAYPKERLKFLLADTGVRVLLTQPHLLEKLPPFQGEVIFPEEAVNHRDAEDTEVTQRDLSNFSEFPRIWKTSIGEEESRTER
jgi:non-ribosomal peptide synthetase component F